MPKDTLPKGCGKKVYTREQVKRALRSVKQRRRKKHQPRQEVHWHYCPQCEAYHLTSLQDLKQRDAKRLLSNSKGGRITKSELDSEDKSWRKEARTA